MNCPGVTPSSWHPSVGPTCCCSLSKRQKDDTQEAEDIDCIPGWLVMSPFQLGALGKPSRPESDNDVVHSEAEDNAPPAPPAFTSCVTNVPSSSPKTPNSANETPTRKEFRRADSVMQMVSARIASLGQPDFLQGLKGTFFFWGSTVASETNEPATKRNISFRLLSALMLVVMTSLSCGCMIAILEIAIHEFCAAHEEFVAEVPDDIPSQHVNTLRESMEEIAWYCRVAAIFVAVVAVVLSFALGCLFGKTVSRPIRRITTRMQRVSKGCDDDPVGPVKCVCDMYTPNEWSSRIKEFNQLNCDVRQLMQGMEMFARYIPETVVRSILRGEERAMRLHVSKRNVTIMFSDIRDFTSISESMRQEDLMFVLTRYLSIMTRIVAAYEGVVAEILGDGLLVYWNTPDDVEDHASKACAAALAQQYALKPLNLELAQFNLAPIDIRIGLHTGQVLSGNMGSDVKMKFGCMGDPVNLSSRLEGLCKVYGVGILCSSDTYDHLQESVFVCREVDVVRVKGKKDPTRIYEVMGIQKQQTDAEEEEAREITATWSINSQRPEMVQIQGAASSAIDNSLRAMQTFDGLRYNPIHSPVHMEKPKVSTSKKSSQVPTLDRSKSMRSSHSSGSVSGIYHPISEMVADGNSDGFMEMIESKAALYEQGLKAYQEANFNDAFSSIESLLAKWPDDGPSKNLLKRIKRYFDPVAKEVILSPLDLEQWDGIEVMHDK